MIWFIDDFFYLFIIKVLKLICEWGFRKFFRVLLSIFILNYVKLYNICDMFLNFYRSLNRNLFIEFIVLKRYIYIYYCVI